MIHKPLDRISKEDIDALVADEVSEGKTLEYKQQLPGGTDSEKKEFLADVSSFANASGGDLLYGIEEQRDASEKQTGIPSAAPGLAGVNADAEILRLENMVRDGIEPRIAGLHWLDVKGFANGPLILARIQKSYAAPHMVTFRDHTRFYSRNSRGKYPLDVQEIRSAFALSESLPEKIRRFRDERVARVVADETPCSLKPRPRIVLHVLPIAALDPTTRFDLAGIASSPACLPPLFLSGHDSRHNLDGFLCYAMDGKEEFCNGYAQLFRSGAIEAVDSRVLRGPGNNQLLPSPELEKGLVAGLDGYLKAQQDLGVQPPLFVMLTLLGVKGYYIARTEWRQTQAPIDRDSLFLPDSVLEDFLAGAATALRPAFDGLWQASGWGRCFLYTESGEWEGGKA